jgi:phage virion morphogenesis protein
MNVAVLLVQIEDTQVRRVLRSLSQAVQDLSPFYRNVGEALLLSTDERFENEVDPQGNPWLPNSAYTASQKRQRGLIQKVLQATGRGRASITYQIRSDRLIVGTNVGYMAKHQLGTNVPKREFLGISPGDREEIIRLAKQHLAQATNPEQNFEL